MSKIGWRGVVAAAPDAAMAATFLWTWAFPRSWGGGTSVRRLMLLMLLEFLVIHSAGIMGRVLYGPRSAAARAFAVIGLGVFYSIFAGAFAAAFETWWPLFAFWGLVLNRLAGVLVGDAPQGEERARVERGWAIGAFFYVAGVFVTLFLPLPALGITDAVIAAQHLPGKGAWIAEPWRVIAFGALYFGANAWSELNGHRWAERKRPAGAPGAGTPSGPSAPGAA